MPCAQNLRARFRGDSIYVAGIMLARSSEVRRTVAIASREKCGLTTTTPATESHDRRVAFSCVANEGSDLDKFGKRCGCAAGVASFIMRAR